MKPTLFLVSLALFAQAPEVHPDKRVTFRLRAPNAKEVALDRETAQRVPMTRDDKGLWSVTTAPLAPDIYGYTFVVDGVRMLDPANPLMKTNLLNPSNMLPIPGGNPWDERDVPHGTLSEHFFQSSVTGGRSNFYVYAPPGNPSGNKLPVLYLNHGFSDGADGWSTVGRAHVILDNLLADGKIKPMLVVMPLGYGDPSILRQATRTAESRLLNQQRFRESLLKEVIPRVEKEYKVSRKREDRAIAGLSMGGGNSLYSGLTSLDTFAWVGAFSASVPPPSALASLSAAANARLKLLWIGCGKDDGLFKGNVEFSAWLKSKDIRHTWRESEGAHTWPVWRRYLAELTPLLFR